MLRKTLINKARFGTVTPDLSKYPKSQTSTLKDKLIKVSKTDQYLGPIEKAEAHLNTNQEPHRAFSLFLFDRGSRLLLQQRASTKITFPNYWTNTCCSHPYHNSLERTIAKCIGIRKAAVRRLKFEMGIRLEYVKHVFPVQKVYYQAKYDDTWGENEVDYVLFARLPPKYENKPEVRFNKEEVKAAKWVSRKEIKGFLEGKAKEGELTTPWMGKILDYRLLQWWEEFERGNLKGDLKQTADLMKN